MIDEKIEELQKEIDKLEKTKAMLEKTRAEQQVTKEESATFKPVENLQVGDVLRLIYQYGSGFKKGETVIVYSLDVPVSKTGDDTVYRRDFTALKKYKCNTLIEYVCDSRYFERVTE